MSLSLGFLSRSIDPYFFVCVSEPYCLDYFIFCGTYSLKWGTWFLQFHFHLSRLLWLFRAFCVSIPTVIFFCSNSLKNAIGNLIGIELNLYIALGNIFIFAIFFHSKNMVSLSICLCHLWLLSSVFYTFLNTGILPPWVGLVSPRYFILFHTMVNGISLISSSPVSLVYLLLFSH